jgi:hypothetical protein
MGTADLKALSKNNTGDISLPEKYYYTLSKSGFKTEKFWLCYIPSLQGLL